jgi:hypothetical protein
MTEKTVGIQSVPHFSRRLRQIVMRRSFHGWEIIAAPEACAGRGDGKATVN